MSLLDMIYGVNHGDPHFGQSYQTPLQQQQSYQIPPLQTKPNMDDFARFGQSYQTPMQKQVQKQAQPPHQFNAPLAQLGAGLLSGQPMTSMLPLAMQAMHPQAQRPATSLWASLFGKH